MPKGYHHNLYSVSDFMPANRKKLSIEQKYPKTTDRENVVEKDWAAGSSKLIREPTVLIYANQESLRAAQVLVEDREKTSAKTASKSATNATSKSATNATSKSATKTTRSAKKKETAPSLPLENIYAIRKTDVTFAPSWLKIIDEPIVNALDHAYRCNFLNKDEPDTVPVTRIDIEFLPSGKIRITNDGNGIETMMHADAGMPVPQFIFGMLHQGSNRVKEPDSIIGGTNGMGAKLSNCFSTEFAVETVYYPLDANGRGDPSRAQLYIQKWTNRMADVGAPTVIHRGGPGSNLVSDDRWKQHTTLSFTPDYVGIYKYEKFDEKVYVELLPVVHTRAVMASMYAGLMSRAYGTPIKVYFNGDRVLVNSARDLAQINHGGDSTVSTEFTWDGSFNAKDHGDISQLNTDFKWEVSVSTHNIASDKSSDKSSDEIVQGLRLSVVNGIVVKEGNHIKSIIKSITAGVKERISKLLGDKNINVTPAMINDAIDVFINCQIPDPGWTGQRKDALEYSLARLDKITLSKEFLDSLSEKLKVVVIESIASKKRKKNQITYDKYEDAHNAGTKNADNTYLCLFEGDSAFDQGRIGIMKNQHLTLRNIGIMCTGGVIVNARKECKEIVTLDKNGNKAIYLHRSEKLSNNEFIKAFLEVTGLNFDYKYDPESPTYRDEIKKLRYGCIVGCVDQDFDGVGNIWGLVLSLFELFWRNLLKAGYVKRFATPVIRVYPSRGGTVLEFYSNIEYEKWLDEQINNGINVDSIYKKPQYYKGLGTHSDDETVHMFKHFYDRLITYTYTDKSHDAFETYFGEKASLRREVLSKPLPLPSPELVLQQSQTRQVSCEDHLTYETDHYQRDNINRKLNGVCDGLTESGRKIFFVAYTGYNHRNVRKIKVAQLAGDVSKESSYHHGEEGLGKTIRSKAFVAVGGWQLPQLLPLSNFGSRLCGGAGAAATRYIYTIFNYRLMNILHPLDDYYLLNFNFDEGVRTEPTTFIPIIPTVICESAELPGHGWRLTLWARDVFKVIANVRRLINIDDKAPLLHMPPDLHGHKGKYGTIRGKPHSFGDYVYNAKNNEIIITELPLRVWTNDYCKWLREKSNDNDDIIVKVINESDDVNVRIVVKLAPGAYEKLQQYADEPFTDGVQEYFLLRNHMYSHINLMGINQNVMEFNDYESVMHVWFPLRKELYARRIQRKITMYELKIMYTTQCINYSKNYAELFAKGPDGPHNRNLSVNEMENILENNGYIKFNKSKLESPGYLQPHELSDAILNNGASYNYLIDDITDRMKSIEGITRQEEKLERLKEELAEYRDLSSQGRFPGALMWEQELDKLEEVIRAGRATRWKFEESGKYKFE